MEFNAHKPIYLQICSQIYEKILGGDLKADDRLLSVRELGIELGVNPNTIMRSYEVMQNAGIIYNKRGIGYFISNEAKELVLKQMKEEFINEELPQVIKKMRLLGISNDEFISFANQKKQQTTNEKDIPIAHRSDGLRHAVCPVRTENQDLSSRQRPEGRVV